MPIDASIYQNVQTPQVNLPQPLDIAQKAMSLSELGMRQRQMTYEMGAQMATRQALADNTDETGNVNKQGALSQLGKMGYGQQAMQMGQQFAAQDKAQAEAKSAQMDAVQKALTLTGPNLEDFDKNVPDDQKAAVWPQMVKNLHDQGVDTSNLEHPYDPVLKDQYLNTWRNNKQHLENLLTQAGTGEKIAQTDKNYAEANKLRSETFARNPNIIGQTNDPAKLVPYFVPKDHQTQAFNEIDAAENTKRMSGNIMDSFEQAVNDTQGVGRATSLVKTPRSAQALHQALQPTFKDLEGTVRQAAMDNTFKNVTPNAGDTAADISTKRQALQQYLQSKASAPTARGYGIDLSKFDSTAAYQPPSQISSKSSNGLSLGGNTANAATPDPRDSQALNALKSMDKSDPKAFQLRSILKSKGLIQ